jgi:hypothetical protein
MTRTTAEDCLKLYLLPRNEGDWCIPGNVPRTKASEDRIRDDCFRHSSSESVSLEKTDSRQYCPGSMSFVELLRSR